jgi:UDP-2,4-diacetamido-2,4,6-trideoxy-beta-L-altropyranose hydrolase
MKAAIRTDASLLIGTGHVMRCMTLADALRGRGAEVRFICREHPGHLIRLLREAGYPTAALPTRATGGSTPDSGRDDHAAWLGVEQPEDAGQTLEALSDFRPDWLIADHYGLDAAWERLLRPRVGRIFAIDDLADRPHDCDLLLDQNLHAEMESRYTGLLPRHARRLLGPRFALLRPEFRKARESLRKRDGTVRRILVFFGGVDSTRETEKAMEALRQAQRPDIAVDVVVGANNPRAEEIRTQCDKMPSFTFHRQAANMAALMAASDFSFGAGGSTHWERCSVGLPAAVTVTAANQSAVTRYLAERRVVMALGPSAAVDVARYRSVLESLTKEQLVALQAAGFALVDGRGADRVTLSTCDEPVQLRRATIVDSGKVWPWRNHARTRQYALDKNVVSRAEHSSWWNRSMNDVSRVLLIGSRCGLDVGVLRYDLGGKSEAVVSIYLDPDLHGQGLGVALLQAGNEWMTQHCPGVSELRAQILPENEASKRAFEAAGFAFRDECWVWSPNRAKIKR